MMILMMLRGAPEEHPSRSRMRIKVPLAVRGERCSSLEGHLYRFGELLFVFHARLPYCDGYLGLVFHPDLSPMASFSRSRTLLGSFVCW